MEKLSDTVHALTKKSDQAVKYKITFTNIQRKIFRINDVKVMFFIIKSVS